MKAVRGMLLIAAAGCAALAGSMRTISIPSQSMGKRFKAAVVLPDSYDSGRKRYPVIYFLHGYSQDHKVWSKVAPLEQFADRYQILCVCPNGDHDSWYIDSPVQTNSRFAAYIGREVPDHIDSLFRTVRGKRGRSLIGSSMGGHGAITIATRYRDRFAGAVSISGILDLTEFPGEWGLPDVLGSFDQNREIWRMYSAIALADSLADAKLALGLDVGSEDFALPGNRRFHQKLQQLGVPHVYCERPGGHTPRYVRSAVEYHVLYLTRAMKNN